METNSNIVRFCTAKELDPITAQLLDVRFTMFLAHLAGKLNLSLDDVFDISRTIMAHAGITQDTLIHNIEDVDENTMNLFNL